MSKKQSEHLKPERKVLLVCGDMMYERMLRGMSMDVIDMPYMPPEQIVSATDSIIDEGLDLVMFTGGADVHPKHYGGEHTGLSSTSPERDIAEMALVA